MPTFEAPGKLMLAGEYSVLDPGGVAVAVAVNPPALRAELTPAAAWELARADLPTVWRQGDPVPDELAFVHAAWRACVPRLGGKLPPHRVAIHRVGSAGTGSAKPGVGGSAGATTVTVAALFGLAGGGSDDELRDLALEVHRRQQGGRGSGYDIATIVHGGLVCWEPETRRARRVCWPDDLLLVAGYSGNSASTPAFLSKVAKLKHDNPDRYRRDMEALAAPVRRLARAALDGDSAALLEAVAPCHRALAAWARRHRLGVVTDELTCLVELAGEAGAAAKVSGAGGGDSAVALCRDPDQAEAVRTLWQRAGFSALDVAPTSRGVRRVAVERSAAPGQP